jgi:hypothetical protein
MEIAQADAAHSHSLFIRVRPRGIEVQVLAPDCGRLRTQRQRLCDEDGKGANGGQRPLTVDGIVVIFLQS